MGEEERKRIRFFKNLLVRIGMTWFWEAFQSIKRMFSKECKIHIFVAVSWIIFVPVA